MKPCERVYERASANFTGLFFSFFLIVPQSRRAKKKYGTLRICMVVRREALAEIKRGSRFLPKFYPKSWARLSQQRTWVSRQAFIDWKRSTCAAGYGSFDNFRTCAHRGKFTSCTSHRPYSAELLNGVRAPGSQWKCQGETPTPTAGEKRGPL